MKNVVVVSLVVLLVALGLLGYLMIKQSGQLAALQNELDSVRGGQVVQDKIVAYFAEVWPELHIMRVEETPVLNEFTVQALAAGEVLSIRCAFSNDELNHNLGEVLLDKVGSLLFPIASLSDELGGQGTVSVNALAGMRVQCLDVADRWVRVRIEDKEGYMPLWFLSLESPSFYMRPFNQTGLNSVDQLGQTPDTFLRKYFAAYSSGNFAWVAQRHAHNPYNSLSEFQAALEQQRNEGYRLWGYEVREYTMISAEQAAVLVNYSYTTVLGRTTAVSEWWRVVRDGGAWKAAWMVRQE